MEQQNKAKLSDKAFVSLILTSILGILLCIVCLCSTTYAWFTGSVQGDNNKIQAAASCQLSVSVAKDGGAQETTIDTQKGATLECEGTYTVTLALPKGSSSGYLVLTVGNVDYYTDYLQRNDNEDQTLTFTLDVKTEKSVTFTARWGIYSGTCHVKNGGTLTIE